MSDGSFSSQTVFHDSSWSGLRASYINSSQLNEHPAEFLPYSGQRLHYIFAISWMGMVLLDCVFRPKRVVTATASLMTDF